MTDTLNHISQDGWVRPSDLMPKDNIVVQVQGSDFMGEWISEAKWVPYKGKKPKNSHRHGRWIHPSGERFGSFGGVDNWRAML